MQLEQKLLEHGDQHLRACAAAGHRFGAASGRTRRRLGSLGLDPEASIVGAAIDRVPLFGQARSH